MAKRERKKTQPELTYDERIAIAEQELADLATAQKAKKKEIRLLKKEKEHFEKESAERIEEEKKAQIADALAKSDKSIEEIMDFLGIKERKA